MRQHCFSFGSVLPQDRQSKKQFANKGVFSKTAIISKEKYLQFGMRRKFLAYQLRVFHWGKH